MKPAPDRATALMASTTDALDAFRGGHSWSRYSSPPSCRNRSRRQHVVGRVRLGGGLDRTRPRGVGRQRLQPSLPGVARLRCVVRLHRLDVPRGRGGRSRRLQGAIRDHGRHRPRVVHRSLRGRFPSGVRRDRLVAEGVADRGYRSVHDLAGSGLRRPRRDGPEHHARGQAAHGSVFRHRPRDGDCLVRHLHHAERLVPGLHRRLYRLDPGPSEDRALVLSALRRPGDRTRDKAGLRLLVRSDGGGGRLQGPRRARRSSSAWSWPATTKSTVKNRSGSAWWRSLSSRRSSS
jgi:hypothetical protein